jgi:hypothetical protein
MFTPTGEHSLCTVQKNGGANRELCPRGQISPLGNNFAPGVKFAPKGVVKMGPLYFEPVPQKVCLPRNFFRKFQLIFCPECGGQVIEWIINKDMCVIAGVKNLRICMLDVYKLKLPKRSPRLFALL